MVFLAGTPHFLPRHESIVFFKTQCMYVSCLLGITPSHFHIYPSLQPAHLLWHLLSQLHIACHCHPGHPYIALCFVGFWRHRVGVSFVSSCLHQVQLFLSTEEVYGPGKTRHSQCTRKMQSKARLFPTAFRATGWHTCSMRKHKTQSAASCVGWGQAGLLGICLLSSAFSGPCHSVTPPQI